MSINHRLLANYSIQIIEKKDDSREKHVVFAITCSWTDTDIDFLAKQVRFAIAPLLDNGAQ